MHISASRSMLFSWTGCCVPVRCNLPIDFCPPGRWHLAVGVLLWLMQQFSLVCLAGYWCVVSFVFGHFTSHYLLASALVGSPLSVFFWWYGLLMLVPCLVVWCSPCWWCFAVPGGDACCSTSVSPIFLEILWKIVSSHVSCFFSVSPMLVGTSSCMTFMSCFAAITIASAFVIVGDVHCCLKSTLFATHKPLEALF